MHHILAAPSWRRSLQNSQMKTCGLRTLFPTSTKIRDTTLLVLPVLHSYRSSLARSSAVAPFGLLLATGTSRAFCWGFKGESLLLHLLPASLGATTPTTSPGELGLPLRQRLG